MRNLSLAIFGVPILMGGIVLLDPMAVGAEGGAQLKVAMSKNDRLCAHVRDVMNKDLEAYGPGYDPRKFAAPIFSTIAWTPIGLDEGFNYGGAVARFDIDNDSKVDTVVRQETSGERDITFMLLFIFDDARFPGLAKNRRYLQENSIGSIDEGPSYIYPFIFDKAVYLLLTDSPDRMAPPRFWVEQYKGGKTGSNRADKLVDVCFIE